MPSAEAKKHDSIQRMLNPASIAVVGDQTDHATFAPGVP